ncbi:hypothetical protein F1880_007957, partial [Penicillium rolfsii]
FECFSAAFDQSLCVASNLTCICLDTSFVSQATGCTTSECGVETGLTATNLTMSMCQVPESSQARISPVLAGVLGMVVLIMVVLRLIQRSVFNRQLGYDDGLIAVAVICAAPLNCLMFPMYNLGLGTNIWKIPSEHITKQLELLYVAEICYMAAEALTQLSFLAFYLRIFPSIHFHRMTYSLMGLSVCFGISNIFVMILQCIPVPYFWSGWTVSLNAKKKLQIILMFCTGFLITVVSCLRLQSLIKFSKSSNVTCGFSSDDNTPAIYWSVVECDIAIICACMPSLPSLLKNLFPSIFGPPSNENYSNVSPPPQFQFSNDSIPLDQIRGRIKSDLPRQVSNSQTSLIYGPGNFSN